MQAHELAEKLRTEGLEAFGRYYSIYAATVADNEDGKGLFLLKVSCPLISIEPLEDWAKPRIFSGKQYGLFALPLVGDNVWIEFQSGDIEYPVWSYGALSENEKPDEAGLQKYLFLSPKGQKFLIEDEEKQITISQAGGFKVILSEEGIRIGKDSYHFTQFLDELFALFEETKTATILGPQPFINVAKYTLLKEKIKNIFF